LHKASLSEKEKPGLNSAKVWQQQFVSHSSFGPNSNHWN